MILVLTVPATAAAKRGSWIRVLKRLKQRCTVATEARRWLHQTDNRRETARARARRVALSERQTPSIPRHFHEGRERPAALLEHVAAVKELYLANTDTISMGPAASDLPDQILQKSAASAKRLIWMTAVGDAIVTPTPISPTFLGYVAELKGHRTVTESAALVGKAGLRPLPIRGVDSTANLKVARFLGALSGSVSRVEPYIADEVAWAFAEAVGEVPVSFGANDRPARSIVTQHLNDKAKFRDFAQLLDVPTAQGAVCESPEEVLEAVRSALEVTGTVILKMARHSRANGNHAISTGSHENILGTASAHSVEDTSQPNLRRAIRDTGAMATRDAPVIVEVYFENLASLGVHFSVAAAQATLLGAAEIVFNPTFGGSFWSRFVVEQLPSEVLEWCQTMAEYCRTVGHVGPLSVDIVKSQSGRYFATEVNGRHGGFSMIRSVAQALGTRERVDDGTRVVLALNGAEILAQLPEVLTAIREAALQYNSTSQCGVVVMSEGFNDFGPYDLVLIGRDRTDVLSIEAKLLDLFRLRDRNP